MRDPAGLCRWFFFQATGCSYHDWRSGCVSAARQARHICLLVLGDQL